MRTSDEFRVIPKPEWVSYEEITDVLHDAHQSTKQGGMDFNAATQTSEKTIKRLGNHGRFYVALTEVNSVAAVGAISFSRLKRE